MDSVSDKDFEHRRDWIVNKITELAMRFAMDVAAYAVGSSYCPLMVRVDVGRAAGWNDKEVLRHRCRLARAERFRG